MVDVPRPHYIVAAVGSLGDLYPFLSVAKGLQARGHKVTFLGVSVHQAIVTQAGLAFHGLLTPEQYDTGLNNPDLWHPRKALRVIFQYSKESMQQSLAYFATLAPNEPLVVLAHPLTLAAVATARDLRPNLTIVGVYLAPSNLPSCYDPMSLGELRMPRWVPMSWRRWLWRQVDKYMLGPVVLPDLNAQRRELGLAPVSSLLALWHSAADLSIALFPAWYGAPQPDWPQPMHMGEFQLFEPNPDQTLSEELSAFLAAGIAPLLFTPGSAHRHAAAYFTTALKAVQQLGRRAIFLTQHRAQVPEPLPNGVLWVAYAPLQGLLPHCAALIHHGGIGTTAEALRAGVPQLVVPFAHDQFDNGERVKALGVGSTLPAARLRVGNLRRRLEGLLGSDDVLAHCRATAARLAESRGADDLCEIIIGAASQRA